MKKTILFYLFLVLVSTLFWASCNPCSDDSSLSMAITFLDKKGNNLYDKTNGFHKDSTDIYFIDEKGAEVKYFDANKDLQESYLIGKDSKQNTVFNFFAVGPLVDGKMTNIIYFKNKKDRDTLVFTLDTKCENSIEKITYNEANASFSDGNRAFTIVKDY